MKGPLTSGQLDLLGREIDNSMEKRAGERVGFMLAIFPFGESTKLAQYISNGNRQDMVSMSRELADYLANTTEDVLPEDRH